MLHTESRTIPFETQDGTSLVIGENVAGEACTNSQGYEVCVSRTVEAVEGGSVTLPCRFAFLMSEKPSNISVMWRIGNFIGVSIFDNTNNQTIVHELFRNRLRLVGDLHKHKASLQITDVRRSDQNTYYCRIIFHTESHDAPFEITKGTHLMIQDAGAGEDCTNNDGYEMCIEKTVEAMVGSSASLPCRFAFLKSEKPSKVSVIWRIGNYLGDSIFDNSDNQTFVHKLFADRLTLMGNPDKYEASLQISGVRHNDQDTYYCRIIVHMKSGDIKYQTVTGTRLVIQDAAVGEVCSNSQGYQLCVTKAVEAVEGGSANLTCRFAFPESKKPSSISVIWRIGNFLGHSIFENTDNRTFVHELFTNRLTLMGNPDKGDASIQIREVRRSDQNMYYCRIMLYTESQEMPFEITKGTNLIIQDAGIGEICSSSNSYEVCVERAVEAVEGGSTTLPCRFAFPESEKPSSISVIWRIGTFLRDSIFERTDNQTHVHELFTNRPEPDGES
ncbi:uncharacterized protein LOC133360501 [Lethenteron reissneri]|uniref:uncharacterized protein LOC133360501 n=1 Tax=Lethenteron reissneri TaxID=7753 RepID=UPI002AB6B39C|nr:uncharacterized protein LOC133360501 [Lethenteron reissneri]